MTDQTRIQQFRQMAEADPTNELGHFSLGKACLDAGQFADAVASLERVLELSPRMSKAYHLLGEAADKAGDRSRAIEAVTKGLQVADEQGDRKPRDAMVDMLRAWGAPVPELASAVGQEASSPESDANSSGFHCSRCGRPNHQITKPPFKGELGVTVQANACEGCWKEWLAMGTKVINELGLALASPAGQEAYDQYLIEFLQLDQR